jgi:hypothetical protein
VGWGGGLKGDATQDTQKLDTRNVSVDNSRSVRVLTATPLDIAARVEPAVTCKSKLTI